jgi:3-vinyl bacteriochlorophyllide hydratase
MTRSSPSVSTSPPGLYTAEQRARRDATPWTWVQGALAPLQFLVCLISAGLVLRCLMTGQGETIALVSVIVKTVLLYTIMVTGCIWEKVVFGQYLFAPAFFWEDVFSMLVLALHTVYLIAWMQGSLEVRALLFLALAAYAAYVINAVQFLLKLRAARLQQAQQSPVNAASAVGAHSGEHA